MNPMMACNMPKRAPDEGGLPGLVTERRQECVIRVEPGLLQRLPRELAHNHAGRRLILLTDDRVRSLVAEEFLRALREAGARAHLITIPEGETSKSVECWQRILSDMHELRFARRDVLLNLGGGLVCDVGGFCAATYLRGVEYINLPTTLLAQHDAGVGGKVALNSPWAKNFIGAFHQPLAVYCDPNVLGTLKRRDLAAGIAEAIKVAVIADEGLFSLLEQHAEDVLTEREPELLGHIVRIAATWKVRLLEDDPFEEDLRRVLNFGHAYGHALETELEYEGILHGEAVAFGMALASVIARERGLFAPEDHERLCALLARYELPPEVPLERGLRALERLEAIRLVRGGPLHYVMPRSIGLVTIVDEVQRGELERGLQLLGLT